MDFHTIRFVVLAAVLYGAMHFAYHQIPDSTLREKIYPTVIGHPAEKVIMAMTPDRVVKVRDNQILAKGVSLNIVRGCDGSGVWFMLLAAVLGFGAKLRDTLIGLLLGTLTVYVINQVRIVGLFYLIEYDRTLFPAVHTYYAPTLIIFLIAGFFLWWTRWTVTRAETVDASAQSGYGKLVAISSIKAFAAWLLLSLAGQFWGVGLVSNALPYYETIVERANPDYHAEIRIEYDENKHDTNIVVAATAVKALPITPGRSLPGGNTIEASVTVKHTLVPLIILLTTLIAFPLKNLRQSLALCVMAIPAVLFVSAVTTPIQLLGNLEIGFINAAVAAGYSREPSWILNWMLLTEGGARWLIPVLVGIACGAIVRRLVR